MAIRLGVLLALIVQVVLVTQVVHGEVVQPSRQLQSRRLHVPQKEKHSWPGFLVPDRERHLGLAYNGDWGRLRAAMARMKRTGNLTVGVVGGSISSGAGAADSHNWVEWLEDWMGMEYNGTRDAAGPNQPNVGNPNIRVANGAVPGTLSSYMSVCYSKHVPQDVDIIIIEYALNDDMFWNPTPYQNGVRRPFERLLRKLLTYPKQPAVILLNAYAYMQNTQIEHRYDGQFYTGADSEFFELATYYQLPMLSIKSCCYRLMKQGVPGFRVDRTRGDNDGYLRKAEEDKKVKDTVFYWDRVHPSGPTGHRAMADLVIQLFMHVGRSLRKRPWSDQEARRLADRYALPDPMITGNWESKSDKCYVGDVLRSQVLPHPLNASQPTFEWVNDQPEGRRAKWGYVASQEGAYMRFLVDTRASSFEGGKVEDASIDNNSMVKKAGPLPRVAVDLALLVSYEGMGLVKAECVSGCECQAQTFNGLHEDKVSLVKLFELSVTQHEKCVIQVTALGKTKSKTGTGTKVKVTGLMISDEGAEVAKLPTKQLADFLALDEVVDAMSDSGTFEVKNSHWSIRG